jgi:hypothetical protein
MGRTRITITLRARTARSKQQKGGWIRSLLCRQMESTSSARVSPALRKYIFHRTRQRLNVGSQLLQFKRQFKPVVHDRQAACCTQQCRLTHNHQHILKDDCSRAHSICAPPGQAKHKHNRVASNIKIKTVRQALQQRGSVSCPYGTQNLWPALWPAPRSAGVKASMITSMQVWHTIKVLRQTAAATHAHTGTLAC